MDKFIKKNERFIDIRSKKAREHFDFMVEYLCSSIIPNKCPPLIKLRKEMMQECHDYISKIIYGRKYCFKQILPCRKEQIYLIHFVLLEE